MRPLHHNHTLLILLLLLLVLLAACRGEEEEGIAFGGGTEDRTQSFDDGANNRYSEQGTFGRGHVLEGESGQEEARPIVPLFRDDMDLEREANDLSREEIDLEREPVPPINRSQQQQNQNLQGQEEITYGGGYQEVVENPEGELAPNPLAPADYTGATPDDQCFSNWMFRRGHQKVWFAIDEIWQAGQEYVCKKNTAGQIYWQKR